jgi:hypothetical protein
LGESRKPAVTEHLLQIHPVLDLVRYGNFKENHELLLFPFHRKCSSERLSDLVRIAQWVLAGDEGER